MSGVDNPNVIVLFCIIGAGALVVLGYAATRHFSSRTEDDDTNDFRKRRDDQTDYMRQVRMQNISWAEMEARVPRSGLKGGKDYASNKGLTATIEPRYETPTTEGGEEYISPPPASTRRPR